MALLRLAVLFGGSSSEHEISIRSARSVLAAVDQGRFEPVPIGIPRNGPWRVGSVHDDLEAILASGDVVHDVLDLALDLVFPVLHGPFGEDGTVQGLLEMLGLPYVGSGVLASALCMDKAMQKHVLAAKSPQIPLVRWLEVLRPDTAEDLERAVERADQQLGYPCFCKPSNLGSSVGVSRCTQASELRTAIALAGRYDQRIIVEQGIDAREIEVAVLGDGGSATIASEPGEIGLPQGTWYDYDTKYLKDVATYAIPAELPAETSTRIRSLALEAFRSTGCEGLARVDFLLDRTTGVAYLNELNTMPGFTSISMYPKLIEHVGIGYPELVSRLCDLGLARHQAKRALRIER